MQTNRQSAWNAALKLLSGRDYSRSEMEQRLARRGYSQSEIEETVSKLKRYSYVAETGSDANQLRAMAQEYLKKKHKSARDPRSLRSLEAFLLRKGFTPDLVAEYLQKLSDATLE